MQLYPETGNGAGKGNQRAKKQEAQIELLVLSSQVKLISDDNSFGVKVGEILDVVEAAEGNLFAALP